MNQSCSLLSLATAVPPHVIEQPDAKAFAREAFGGKKALFDRLSGVFDNAGIASRHIVAPLDWYMTTHGWHDRNAVYLEAAERLFIEAATTAIERAGLMPDQIDGSATGLNLSVGGMSRSGFPPAPGRARETASTKSDEKTRGPRGPSVTGRPREWPASGASPGSRHSGRERSSG